MSRPVVLLRAGAMAHGGLAPRGLGRHAGGRLALAAAVRMVARVHDHAAHLGPAAHVASAAGLAEALVLVVEVADLADRGHAAHVDAADLAGGQADLGVVALLGQELGRGAGRAHDLAALAGHQLDVVDAACRAGWRAAAGRCRPAPRRFGPATTVSPTWRPWGTRM